MLLFINNTMCLEECLRQHHPCYRCDALMTSCVLAALSTGWKAPGGVDGGGSPEAGIALKSSGSWSV